MKNVLFCFILIFCASISYAQTEPGDIEIKKVFGGIQLKQDGRVLKPKEVLSIMKPVPEAYAAYKKAKSNYNGAQVMGFVGGFLIGWPLGTAIGGGDPEWGLAAAGAGVLLLSIPLSKGYSKNARNAVSIYNAQTGQSGRLPVSLSFSPYVGGARVVLKF